jgi:hypothetical protein
MWQTSPLFSTASYLVCGCDPSEQYLQEIHIDSSCLVAGNLEYLVYFLHWHLAVCNACFLVKLLIAWSEITVKKIEWLCMFRNIGSGGFI